MTIQQHKISATVLILLGMITNWLARYYYIGVKDFAESTNEYYIYSAFFLSIPLIIWGACHYAKSKGYPYYFGSLAIFLLLGLIVLVLLKPYDEIDNTESVRIKNMYLMRLSGLLAITVLALSIKLALLI